MREQLAKIIKESWDSAILIGNNDHTTATKTVDLIMQEFQDWLRKQADIDSPSDPRQTRAYDLYLRLEKE